MAKVVKYYCDKCGVEVTTNYADTQMDYDDWYVKIKVERPSEFVDLVLCKPCMKVVAKDVVQNGRV